MRSVFLFLLAGKPLHYIHVFKVNLSGVTPPPSSACDLNGGGQNPVDVADVQLCVNQAIKFTACLPAGQPGSGDITGEGVCAVNDVQRVVNAVLGGACVIGP